MVFGATFMGLVLVLVTVVTIGLCELFGDPPLQLAARNPPTTLRSTPLTGSGSRLIKKEQPKKRLDELAQKFEDIEHQQFGKDGFDDAVARIARIEQMLGLNNLDHYTAAPPPHAG